jgi:hypothetical protein
LTVRRFRGGGQANALTPKPGVDVPFGQVEVALPAGGERHPDLGEGLPHPEPWSAASRSACPLSSRAREWSHCCTAIQPGQASRTETSEAYDSGMVILSYQPQPRA